MAKAPPDLAARIVDAALTAAAETSWDAVRLVDIAARLKVPATAVLAIHRDKDAVADAWFGRALAAMLAAADREGFADLPPDQRVERCMLAWFDALAPYHAVTVQMLRGKLQPGHPHHWVPMVFNLSRTVHWLREAARLPAVYGTLRAQLEEIGLTTLFLATLAVWSRDRTEGQQRTRDFLRRRLEQADRILGRFS
jgi:AcrR family transcriptional regulator